MASYDIYKTVRERWFDPSGNFYSGTTSFDYMGQYVSVRSPTSRRKKSQIFNPPTALNRFIQNTPPNGYDQYYSRGVYYNDYVAICDGAQILGQGTISLLSFDDNLTSKAELKCLLKLKDQQVNLSVAFGERAATAAGIAETVTAIARAINNIKKLNVRGAKKALGVLPKITKREQKILGDLSKSAEQKSRKLWLGMQYAWLPLLQDVHGAATELAKNDSDDPSRYRATVNAKSSKSPCIPQYVLDGTGPTSIPRREIYTDSSKMSAYVSLTFCTGSPLLTTASRLGFTNPLSVAWELLPLSFVADWFYPISDYINSLDATLGWDFMGGSCTKRIVQKMTVRATAYPYPVWYLKAIPTVSGSKVFTSKTVNRTVYIVPPVPDLVRPKNPFSGRHLASAVALLSQTFHT